MNCEEFALEFKAQAQRSCVVTGPVLFRCSVFAPSISLCLVSTCSQVQCLTLKRNRVCIHEQGEKTAIATTTKPGHYMQYPSSLIAKGQSLALAPTSFTLPAGHHRYKAQTLGHRKRVHGTCGAQCTYCACLTRM